MLSVDLKRFARQMRAVCPRGQTIVLGSDHLHVLARLVETFSERAQALECPHHLTGQLSPGAAAGADPDPANPDYANVVPFAERDADPTRTGVGGEGTR